MVRCAPPRGVPVSSSGLDRDGAPVDAKALFDEVLKGANMTSQQLVSRDLVNESLIAGDDLRLQAQRASGQSRRTWQTVGLGTKGDDPDVRDVRAGCVMGLVRASDRAPKSRT